MKSLIHLVMLTLYFPLSMLTVPCQFRMYVIDLQLKNKVHPYHKNILEVRWRVLAPSEGRLTISRVVNAAIVVKRERTAKFTVLNSA